jgi:hypothetical protein
MRSDHRILGIARPAVGTERPTSVEAYALTRLAP